MITGMIIASMIASESSRMILSPAANRSHRIEHTISHFVPAREKSAHEFRHGQKVTGMANKSIRTLKFNFYGDRQQNFSGKGSYWPGLRYPAISRRVPPTVACNSRTAPAGLPRRESPGPRAAP